MGAEALVFVVDDNAPLRTSLQDLMRSVGLRVAAFASAQEFLDRPRPDGPSCLVLDVRLPGLSGLDLQQGLAEGDRDMPIIFIAGHGAIPMTVQAMKAWAVEFLSKPFRDQALLDAIQQALAHDRQARAQRAQREALRCRYRLLTPRERDVMALVVAGLQQADRGRAGHERGLRESAPPTRDGQDGRRFPSRPGLDGGSAQPPHPTAIGAFTKG
jgi:FixJ family two-component response regulator